MASVELLDPVLRDVAVLANPMADRPGYRAHVHELLVGLEAERLVPHLCWQREELSELVARGGSGLRCVVAAGGDGTLAEVLNRAPGVPVGLLPLGHENLVARHYGLDESGWRAARLIAAGNVRRLDLARVGDRLASLMVGVGFDADVVHTVHAQRQGPVTRLSYALPVLRSLRDYPFPPIDVEIEDTGERLRGAMVFVFNLPRYGLDLPLAPAARADDGLLDVYVFGGAGRWWLACHVWAILCQRQQELPGYQYRTARRVRLWSEQRVPVQADGDPAGVLPVSVEVAPRALSLIVPPDSDS